jgi:serine/threonine protein kinase
LENQFEFINNTPQFRVNQSLFEIDEKDLTDLVEIGLGGSGNILFRAKWKNEVVALKLYRATRQEQIEEFENELELLQLLQHPNIVSFYGACLKMPRIGIVVEYCENGSLAKYIEKNKGKIKMEQKVALLLHIAKGMRFLHSKGVIHRDLKCDNILLDANMTPKISDFGFSVIKSAQRTRMTQRCGTSTHMAPELVLNDTYDERVDIFSFGILMFELLAESTPYGSNPSPNLELKVAKNPLFRPVFPETVVISQEMLFLVNLMSECWSAAPEERPSFEELCTTMESRMQKL